jgi:protein involved in polysaccharide export with SLBB domain
MKTQLLAIGYLISVVAAPLLAQQSPSALASRQFLQSELTRLGNDPSAELIRARLASGDFQAGDRIFLRVRGDSVLTDTFTVLSGLQLPLPALGAVPLRGVLRSELKDTIFAYLSHYLRDPIIEVRPLMRIVVEGQVLRPGFVAAAPEQPLADVISAAGGFTQQAKVTDIRLQRGGTTILSGRKLTDAMGQGYSLDRLSVRAGDRVFVPGHADSAKTLQMVSLLLALPLTILALRRAF